MKLSLRAMTRKQIVEHFAPLIASAEQSWDTVLADRLLAERNWLLQRRS